MPPFGRLICSAQLLRRQHRTPAWAPLPAWPVRRPLPLLRPAARRARATATERAADGGAYVCTRRVLLERLLLAPAASAATAAAATVVVLVARKGVRAEAAAAQRAAAGPAAAAKVAQSRAPLAAVKAAQDLSYPPYFRGEWDVSRDLYALSTTAEDSPLVVRLRATIGPRQQYRVRFVERHLSTDASTASSATFSTVPTATAATIVVQDRKNNYSQELRQADPTIKSAAVMWNIERPDLITAACARQDSSLTRELKFIEFAGVENVPDGSGGSDAIARPFGFPSRNFTAIEVARIVDHDTTAPTTARNGRRGTSTSDNTTATSPAPNVYIRRQVTKYRVSAVDDDGLPDELKAQCIETLHPPSPPDAPPFATLKYRIFLTRKGRRSRVVKSRLAIEKQLIELSRKIPSN